MSRSSEIAAALKEGETPEKKDPVVAEAFEQVIPKLASKGILTEEETANPIQAMSLTEATEIAEQVAPSHQLQGMPHWSFLSENYKKLALLTAIFWRSGYFVEKFSNKEQMFVVLVGGFDIGLSPINAINDTALIKGKLTIHSTSKVSLVLRHPLYSGSVSEWFGGTPQEMIKEPNMMKWSDDFGCRFKVWQKGIDEPQIGEWSVAMAKHTKNWGKATWASHPFHMLSTRAFDQATRIVFAYGAPPMATELAVEIARNNNTLTPDDLRKEQEALASVR